MPVSYPNESQEYRKARGRLLAAERDLRDQAERVAELRREMPLGGEATENYNFSSLDGTGVGLSDLFGENDTLAVYSLMYGPGAEQPCPMCTSFLNGLLGQLGQIGQRMSFAVVAQSAPERLAGLQLRMGWKELPLYSAAGTGYQSDYLAENTDGDQLPIMNVFVRRNGKIRHFWGSELFFEPSAWHPRHMDMLWPMWNLLDLTPEGRGDFLPGLAGGN